jgi:superfamily II DNA or RNA helicase
MIKQLRPYQAEGKKQIFERWDEISDLVMFVLATGGGKTVTFTEVIREGLKQGKRALLIAHRQELIEQAWETLYDNEIYAGVIMSGYPEKWELPVQVCSIQTIARRKELPPADYIIIDEAHHVLKDNSYGKILARYPDAKVLMVTATPYRLSGEGFDYIHPYKKTTLVISRTLKQLMEEAWLVPIRYYIASVPELDNVGLQAGDYKEDESAKAMELAPLVDSYIEHAQGKRGVVFCINVAHSKEIIRQYNEAGIPAAHLDANTPDEDYPDKLTGEMQKGRKNIIAGFRSGEIMVISNVGIITEGFDMPDMEFVQLARPTKSLSMFLQMVGRGTRAVGGLLKSDSTVEERKELIANSNKPYCIVLDNAGCWLDHGMPDYDHDWVDYFRGKKPTKKPVEDGEIEMLVFIAFDESTGRKIRTHNAKEIEGMKLIEVKTEIKKKVINIKSIKEFDRMYQLYKRLPQVKKSGYVTYHEFIKHCQRTNILIVDDIWEYLHTKLIKENKSKLDSLYLDRATNPERWSDDTFLAQIKKITAEGVSEEFFKDEYRKYVKANANQIEAYATT